MPAEFIASVDQGTASSRCLIFDSEARVVSVGQKEHHHIFPRPGWVEHDPEEIWHNVVSVVQEALSKAQLQAGDLTALGITNQRETTVVWDRETGRPVHNAITWQDMRTDKLIREFGGDVGQDRFKQRCGLPLATYFSGPKLAWLLDHVDGLRERAEAGEVVFGTMDSWLIWKLTGEHFTDVTNASRTMLMNLATLDWDPELLDALGVPRAMLPEIRSSSEIYGEALILGGVPVASALGDQHAALFGQTCFERGDAKCTYGTGSFLLMNTGDEPVYSANGLLTTVGYKIGDSAATYALEGSIAVTGALVQWLRDNLELIGSAPEIETLARTVDDNGGCYFVPAFSGLFAPHWRSDARGVIAGLDRLHHEGSSRPRRARGHGVPDPRSGRGDERRRDGRPRVAARRRRHDREQPADAVPGRHARRAGRPADRGRDAVARRGLRRRAGGRLLAGHRQPARALAPCRRVAAADGRRGAREVVPQVEEDRRADPRLGRRRRLTSRSHHGIAPRSRETARAASRT